MLWTSSQKTLLVLLRLSMAWVFLYAASHQVFNPEFSVTGFLSSTKTFHGVFAPFTNPAVAPFITFLVAYGHLLIGLSLLVGLMTRLSSVFGIGLMLVYWMAHMDFPYISNANNFLLDEHIVYALVLGLVIAAHAGHVWGLDAWAASQRTVKDHKWLDWVTA